VREQHIVVLYYYRGMTQARIGQQPGTSQMHVSRGLARAVDYIRPGVSAGQGTSPAPFSIRCPHWAPPGRHALPEVTSATLL
jgi:hypothetical protein